MVPLSAVAAPDVKQILGGKYRIERVLGEGGMGAVYLAENLDIGRKVAIKLLHAKFDAESEVARRFRLEARAAAAIGHPGIVDVLDLGVTDAGEPFIVMERLDGETLGAKLAKGGALSARDAVGIVCEVLLALGAAHDKHIVHRDLKPENLFLCERPERRTKILDFGISKFATDDLSLTRTGTVMGTPLYMSPEQARDAKGIGPASDLYSVGAILYEALSGRPPFSGNSYNEVIANILMEPHPPLVNVPPPLAAVVDRLLDKDPARRPGSATEAIAALQQALLGGPASVPIAPRRTRSWWVSAAVGALVLATAAGWWMLFGPASAPAPAPTPPAPAVVTPVEAPPSPAVVPPAPAIAAPRPAPIARPKDKDPKAKAAKPVDAKPADPKPNDKGITIDKADPF